MPQHEQRVRSPSEVLEPCALKGARTVLRGGRRSNTPSLPDPQGGYELIGNRLRLSKIGHVKIKLHREIKGKIKTCTIKREGDQWHAVFSTEYELDPTLTFHPKVEGQSRH